MRGSKGKPAGKQNWQMRQGMECEEEGKTCWQADWLLQTVRECKKAGGGGRRLKAATNVYQLPAGIRA